MSLRLIALAAAAAGMACLGGCATQPKTLYYWGDYQSEIYEYMQSAGGGDIAKQTAALEAGYQKAKAENKALPPGYHAQLGLLYFNQGKVNLAAEQLELEKSEFPESATFMDRLLSKFKQQ